ncbi:extracellular solute-binding protein [Streptomyces sp. NPDC006012]|uniref:extracellular solute-binding protein n=1 Tax=Streptomyces sp. NPDC006012 TaxID=3364739 RepID=UPI0036BC36DC
MSAPGNGPAAVPATRRGPSRRAVRTGTVLASCLALLVAAVVVGVRVYDREPTVTLLANWTGKDERAFRDAVIAPFERKYRIHVDYQGSSAQSQVLSADVEAGTPPDVVVLTGPGELASYVAQRRLKSLDGLVPEGAFSASWTTRIDGHVYWFPLKADLKSIVWYPGDMTEQQRRDAAGQPAQWCLGLGAAATSGWPGTDWIEDLLLQQSGWRTYDKWARGELRWTDPAVRRAWTAWRDLVVGSGENERLVSRALETHYQDASAYLAKKSPQCSLEHQASFIGADDDWKKADGRYEASATLLGTGYSDAWEVSGDLVALLHETPAAKQLIRYLASTEAGRVWSVQQSGFSVRTGVPAGSYGAPGTQRRRLADTLRDRRAVHCFDASDAMPPAVRDVFAQSTIDFLARPGDLTSLLKTLDTLRTDPKLTWLPSVCDRTP